MIENGGLIASPFLFSSFPYSRNLQVLLWNNDKGGLYNGTFHLFVGYVCIRRNFGTGFPYGGKPGICCGIRRRDHFRVVGMVDYKVRHEAQEMSSRLGALFFLF